MTGAKRQLHRDTYHRGDEAHVFRCCDCHFHPRARALARSGRRVRVHQRLRRLLVRQSPHSSGTAGRASSWERAGGMGPIPRRGRHPGRPGPGRRVGSRDAPAEGSSCSRSPSASGTAPCAAIRASNGSLGAGSRRRRWRSRRTPRAARPTSDTASGRRSRTADLTAGGGASPAGTRTAAPRSRCPAGPRRCCCPRP